MRFHHGTIFFMTVFLAFLALLVADIHGSDASAEEPTYHTYEEVMNDYQDTATAHPDIAEFINLSDSLGTLLTYGNRSLYAMRITDQDEDPADSEREPAILITSIHHAREWISVEVTSYFMHYLIDNYGTDPYVTYLVDNRDIWIIPFVNPDGYVQSWAQNDREQNNTGWRKNLRDNNENGVLDSSDGVDLNRNYGYLWGYDGQGSSGEQSSTTYRGPAPFSEPETQTIAALCNATPFTISIHYHSKGNQILYPWAYEALDTDDHEKFVMIGEQMSIFNGYEHGNTKDGIIYKCNGEACDWQYAEHGTFAFTIELGYGTDRYIPDETRILPICEENLQVNLFTCFIADEPSSSIGFADPDTGSATTDDWSISGSGEQWVIVPGGLSGPSAWSIEVSNDPETHAILALNRSVITGDDYSILSFWESSSLAGGSVTGVYLAEDLFGENMIEVTEILGDKPGTRGSADPANWILTHYNLTPFIDDTPRYITFVLESDSDGEGDHWSIDGLMITSSLPSEYQTASDDRGPGDQEFSISPDQRDLLQLPDSTTTVTVEVTNDDDVNNTIEITPDSDRGWDISVTFGESEMNSVTLGPGQSITLNVTITIPAGVVADEVATFTVFFQSQDNASQNHTLSIDVTIEAFYSIILENPGNLHMLPGEERVVELELQNLGNSNILIKQDADPTGGEYEEWNWHFDENPTVVPFGTTTLYFTVIAPAQINKDKQISVEVITRVDEHASGDGTAKQEFFFIIDEMIDAGFLPIENPEAQPGIENTYNIQLFNYGNDREKFYLSLVSAWSAEINRDSIEVDQYSYVIIQLTLIPPTDVDAGDQEIVRLRLDNPIQNSTSITFTATSFYMVSLSSSKLNQTIPAGREKSFRITVHNLGNDVNHITLSPSSVDGFDVSISKTELTIPAFGTAQADVLINVSMSKPFDQDNSIEVSATSDDDPDQQTTLSFRITVGRSYEVKVSIDSEGRKQTVSPKGTVEYVISLQNLGNAQTIISLSVKDIPNSWVGVLDDSEVSLDSEKTRFIRLTVTAPSGAKNQDEARIVVVAEAGDSAFGYVDDEIIATAVVSASEDEGGVSGLMIAGGLVVVLLLAGAFLFMKQQQAEEEYDDTSDGDAYPDGSDSDPSGVADSGDATPSPLTDSGPIRQNVSCPKCESAFEVELPAGDKPTVKTMCVDCGEIFSFDREVPPPVPVPMPATSPISSPAAPTQQHVSCPKCESAFDVELPAGDKPTVKTMCVDCGEIFSFDREVPPPVPAPMPATSPIPSPAAPTQQHVSCPKCESAFDVELPPGDKPTVKTMCVDCGEIFSFDRIPRGSQEAPAPERDPAPPSPPSTDLPPSAFPSPEAPSQPSQIPSTPPAQTPEDTSARMPQTPSPQDQLTHQAQPPAQGPTPGVKAAVSMAPSSSDPSRPTSDGPRTSAQMSTGESREVSRETGDGSKLIGAHDTHVALPKVMKCPKCSRKVFLKGKEEKVKCIFCGTRIQIERRKRGTP